LEHNALDMSERHEYYHILQALDANTLKEWTSKVVRKHQENLKNENKNSNTGGIWSMFSWVSGGNKEEEKGEVDQSYQVEPENKAEFHISDEELKEINSIVQSAIEETNEEDTSDGNLMIQVQYECLGGQIHIEDD